MKILHYLTRYKHFYQDKMMVTFDLPLKSILRNPLLLAIAKAPASLFILLLIEVLVLPPITSFAINFYIAPILDKYINVANKTEEKWFIFSHFFSVSIKILKNIIFRDSTRELKDIQIIKKLLDMMKRSNIIPILGNYKYMAHSVLKKFNAEITSENYDKQLDE